MGSGLVVVVGKVVLNFGDESWDEHGMPTIAGENGDFAADDHAADFGVILGELFED
ncbi:MAG: hypothetical protein N3J91_07015 [Verrucomicrobiae bacterium]|nr:hypothetical protein [Verrucomicrobiae bacterium]